jgi:hypothetical protein
MSRSGGAESEIRTNSRSICLCFGRIFARGPGRAEGPQIFRLATGRQVGGGSAQSLICMPQHQISDMKLGMRDGRGSDSTV